MWLQQGLHLLVNAAKYATLNFSVTVMNDRPPLNEAEAEARRLLVDLAHSMLSKKLSFFEGAVQVLRLKTQVGGIKDSAEDLNTFVGIVSKTDHLPLKAQRHLWSSKVLAQLEPEFIKKQELGRDFCN